MTSISRQDLYARFDALGDGVPDSVEYQALTGLVLQHETAERLGNLDPFSSAYADAAMALYADIRGRDDGYEPERDEQAGFSPDLDIWTEIVPWSFRNVGFVADFLSSWANIMRCLDIAPGQAASVLEYGPGSGQLLLLLARLGIRSFGVDIDPAPLAQIKAQSDAMSLGVEVERATFGEGFGDRRFDRIVFFEAFHHAFAFPALLDRLQDRLLPGGRLVFCGEPILPHEVPPVPYPWGPRLDGLSVFCIRRFGWMELGFTRTFFTEALQRAGWLVEHRPCSEAARGDAFIAFSCLEQPLALGRTYDLGRHASGWHASEGHHRWTNGSVASLPLPARRGLLDVRLRLANPLPVEKRVTLRAGSRHVTVTLAPHEHDRDLRLDGCVAESLSIETDAHRPCDLMDSTDDRLLGVLATEFQVDRRER